MKGLNYIALLSIVFLTIVSCTGDKDYGPIVLGDSATIVTEKDPVYLEDLVLDLDFTPVKQEEEISDSQRIAQASKHATVNKEMMLSGGGLKVPFPQVTMFIPSITTRTFQEQDLKKAYGASYQITSGALDNNYLILQGATITSVEMRYQTVIMLKNELGMMELASLRKLTDWMEIDGKNGMYKIPDLSIKHLKYTKVSNRGIVNAVNRATKSKRMRRSSRVRWENSVKGVNATNQKPLYPVLRAVMWKVRGKDKDGTVFQRTLRIDLPVRIP